MIDIIRAAKVCALGHHALVVGDGSRFADLVHGFMPELTDDENREVQRIKSASGFTAVEREGVPYRFPHHSTTMVALVGGGAPSLRPGEMTLAHRGVLYLQDVQEFPPHVLDAMRQPLETGEIRISRGVASVVLPAKFSLVASIPKCPRDEMQCTCSDRELARFRRRISGPLVDRFDIRIEADDVPDVPTAPLVRPEIPTGDIDMEPILAAIRVGSLTQRGAERVERLARTFAAIDGVAPNTSHVEEALTFRTKGNK